MSRQTDIDESPQDGDVYDLIVVGGGAGGMSAAVTAAHLGMRVAVLEKEPVLGGTTAWSGGWLWIPRNPLAQEAGIVEPTSDPLKYLTAIMGERAKDPRIARFLDAGPQMVGFFREKTAVEWIDGNGMPDFFDLPGSVAGGRSVCAAPFDGRKLGPWIKKLRPPLAVAAIAGMGIGYGADLKHFFNATRRLRSAIYVVGRFLKHTRDLLLYRRGMQLMMGNALAARLIRSALDADVALFTDCPVTGVLHGQNGVTGVSLQNGVTLTAKKGVVIAAGGFPHAADLQAELFTDDTAGAHFSAAPPSNTGDGLKLGQSVGAVVSTDLGNAGAWAPVSLVANGKGGFHHFPHLVERAKPGFIAVAGQGVRFTNEADSYHAFMRGLFNATPKGQDPSCWLIADHRAQRHWGLGWSWPFPFPLGRYRRLGYLKSARTLDGLAQQCGLDAETLKTTVATFNANADRGVDPDFGRGASRYNQAQGDPEHRPNSSLGAVTRGPFHAVKIVSGSLGTFAGLKTDEDARVLDKTGQPIPGLYAAGNDMSSIFQGYYPSGGITLGPAMTFGYIAAHTAADHTMRTTLNTPTLQGGIHATV